MLNADLFRDRRSQLAKVVLLMCGCYFALAFAGQAWKAKGLGETLQLEQAKLVSQEKTNRQLQARLDFLNGPGYEAYVENVARAQLGMAKPGDISLFVVPDPRAPGQDKAPLPPLELGSTTGTVPEPVWRQWLAVFFPS